MVEGSEEAELQARIAALSDKINEHKQQHQQHRTAATPNAQSDNRQNHGHHNSSYRGRWSPYGGRGGKAGYAYSQNRRTWVAGGAHASPPSASVPTVSTTADASDASLLLTRAPGRESLMNKDTFEREQKRLQLYKDGAARAATHEQVNRDERHALVDHVNASSSSDTREVIVQGIRFQLHDDGNKLVRIHGKLT